MMDKFPTIGYRHVVDNDSDATMDYYPIVENKSTKAVEILLDKGKESLSKPHKRLIQAYPFKCGLAISIHGVKRRKSRTYLGCKVQGCKSRFSKARDWNSHHQRIHAGICLECDTCRKMFKTPSFLWDHQYAHQDTQFVCENCNKCFMFKSKYQIHRQTHLRSRIHKCFAGSCGKEYKWLQDLNRHIQVHLNCQCGYTVCNHTKWQKYLLRWHL